MLQKLNAKVAGGLLITGGLCVFLSAGVVAQTGQTSATAKPPASSTSSTHTSSTAKKKTTSKSKASRARGQMTPTPDRIKEIQAALVQADVYQSTPTGKWDNATVEAMKKFQQSNGLNPSGKLNALSLQKLGLGSGTAGRGAPRLTPPASTPSSPTTPRSK